MKIHFTIFVAASVLLMNCSSWKQTMVSKGIPEGAVHNAIIDFLHSGKFDKKDTVFKVRMKNIDQNIIAISIIADPNKINVITDDKINYNYKAFPTNYLERNGKLFYWDDSTQKVSPELISKLYKMNRVDTTIIGKNFNFPHRIYDDSKKAMDYYFCKSNLRIYKKVYSKIAIGWYEPPQLNCE